MIKKIYHIYFYILIFIFLFNSNSQSEIIKNIIVTGNERIQTETILMFSGVKINDDIESEKLNLILKNLYQSNFFENVNVTIDNSNLNIHVVELPIIENIFFDGVKANKIKNAITENLKIKSRSSYNETVLLEDQKKIGNVLKNLGYYFSKVETYVENLNNNKINIRYKIDLGNKAKIRKISFIGDKIFKTRKLRSLIVSEEYKFWKFISGKKYLNENITSLDERLLKNFYLNQGYYDVRINTSYAKLVNDDEFELIFSITPNKKFFFNNLLITLPSDFQKENFNELNEKLNKFKGEKYSINIVRDILESIDRITVIEEYKSVKAYVDENIIDDKINLNFIIEETEKVFVEKINIFGNNVTRENVIRNQLEIDEGDPFNEILTNKSTNNLKSLNFFKNVSSKIVDGNDDNSKVINFTVEEKATGELSAGAGFGTDGGTLMFGVKENNYLGKGLAVNANAILSEESLHGRFSVTNPNYNNTDKSVFFNIQALETDKLKNFGYKTNKTGFEIGTNFEYLDKFNLGISSRSFYEKIETDSSASATQKKQEGDYWDTFLKLNFDYDKRNQRFKTSDGFRSLYTLDIPLISETNTLTNTYNYNYFSQLYENNLSSISFYLKSATSITGKDVKLSERLTIPSSKLRGFERGKVGPKDGADFIGGNYISSINFKSTLPYIFENNENVDLSLFFDAANIWGIDYDSSLDDGSKIRTSLSLGVDWFTAVGPLNFSLSETFSKAESDVTESFRFNIGTSF